MLLNEKKQSCCNDARHDQRRAVCPWHVHALIPQWNAFKPGIVLGVVGLVLAVVTVIVWRKMEHKAPVHLSGKAVLTILAGIVGALAFGVGMCFSMVWGNMVLGIVIGLAGIAVLLCLIPLTKGIKD